MTKVDLGGVWRTVGGRRIFIKDGEDLETAMKKSGKFKKSEIKGKDKREKVKKIEDMTQDELERNAIADKLKDMGAQVDKDGNVTLYHITTPDNYEKIMKSKEFIGNQSPIGGGGAIEEEIGDRSFFTWDKNWTETWRQSEDSKIISVKVPAEYIRQGAQNEKEIYIEGNLKLRKNNIWTTDKKPTSTFYDRIAVRKYKAKNLKK